MPLTKRPSAIDNPPSASPSSDEEEFSDTEQPQNPKPADSETDNDDSSSEEELEEETEKPSVENSDDDGSGSDTESTDTAPSPTASDFTVKPIVAKPVSESPKPKKGSQNLIPSASKSAKKPPVVGKTDVQMKGKPNGGLDQKKSPIVRFWTEDGEVAILKGMHEYKVKKGVDPYADTNAFYEYMKKFVPVEVTKVRLLDKIRRLKKKYANNAAKGDEPVFSKAHEQKSFELSKKIWGGAGGSVAESGGKNGKKRKVEKSVGVDESVGKESNGEKSAKKAKKVVPLELVKENGKESEVEEGVLSEKTEGGEVGFWDKYPRLKEAMEVENYGCFFLKDGKRATELDLSKIGDAKAKELESRWKLFQAEDAKLKLMRLDLLRDQTKMVYEELMKP